MLRNLLKSILVLTAVFAFAASADALEAKQSLSKWTVSDDLDSLGLNSDDISNLIKDLKPMKGEKDEYVRLNGKIPAECKDKIALTLTCNVTENKIAYTVEEISKDGFACLKANKEKCANVKDDKDSKESKDSKCISFEDIAKTKSNDVTFLTRVDSKSSDVQCQKIKVEAVKVGVLKKDFSDKKQAKVEGGYCKECEERKDKQIVKLQTEIEDMQEKLDKKDKKSAKRPSSDDGDGDKKMARSKRDADVDPNDKLNSLDDDDSSSSKTARGNAPGGNRGSQNQNDQSSVFSASIATLINAYMQSSQLRNGNSQVMSPYANNLAQYGLSNPYASQYSQQTATNPFASTYGTTSYNPYAATASAYNPYATTTASQYNPYATTSAYGTSTYNPYATTTYNPYTASTYNPYASLYGTTAATYNPYAYNSGYSTLGTSTGTYANNYVGTGFSIIGGTTSATSSLLPTTSTQAYGLGTRGR